MRVGIDLVQISRVAESLQQFGEQFMRRVFTDVEEGDELPVSEVELTADRIREYARAAGMWAPRFTDDEAARREGLPGMIAPGNLSMGLLGVLVEGWAYTNTMPLRDPPSGAWIPDLLAALGL